MAKKLDVEKLLKKRLSGYEAGKLAIQDSWRRDRNQDPLFTDAGIRILQQGLKTPLDKEAWNQMMYAYEIIDFTFREANRNILEAKGLLWETLFWVEQYKAHKIMTWGKNSLPAIMTEARYQELKAEQREERLQEEISLYWVASERAGDLAPDEIEVEGEAYSICGFEDLEDISPDLAKQFYNKALDELTGMIEDSTLPLANKTKKDKARVMALIKKYRKGTITEVEMDEYQKLALFRGVDLYNVLPGWKDRVEAYYHEDARPVALVQDTQPFLDDQGNYVGLGGKDYRGVFDQMLLVESLEENEPSMRPQLLGRLTRNINTASLYLKMYYSTLAIFENLSGVLGFDLTQEMRGWLEEILGLINWYNRMVREEDLGEGYKLKMLPEGVSLPAIDLDQLQVSQKYYQMLKERLGAGLGADWYHESLAEIEWKDGTNLRQILASIKEEEGRLPYCWKWIEK